MYSNEVFVKNVKEKAAEKGLKIGELCRNVGVNRNIFSQLSGKQGITAATLYRLADELGCSTDCLLGRADR